MSWNYQTAGIGEVVLPVCHWNPRESDCNALFYYVDIASINRETKKIEEFNKVFSYEAPSRARQIIKSGDVLVSTVRPNLNAVAYVDINLDSATASTGFTVLRANPKKVDARYLYFWVRTPYFVQEMVRKSTGASYPAVSFAVHADPYQ